MNNDQNVNLGRAFQRVAEDYPRFPAIISEHSHLTYEQLFSLVVAFARQMQAHGVGRGSLVALNTGDTIASLSTLLATALLGSRFVVASMVLAKQKAVAPTHFFKTPEARGKAGVPFVEINESWMPTAPSDPAAAYDEFEGYESPDHPWIYLNTSGTTGNPKTLSLSQAAVFRRTMAVASDFPLARATMASLFANTSRPFYARALGALLHGGTIVDSQDTAVWQKAGVNLVFGSPRQLEQFLNTTTISPPITRVEVSGAKLTDELALTLAGSFSHITDVYGASETSKSFSSIVSITPDGSIARLGKALDSTIEILDQDGKLCAPGIPGAVRVRNDYMAPGYLNSPKATAKSFQNGWFYPGDIACWGPSGELQVIGRSDDVLSFGGLKLDAALIDLIIKVTPGVEDAICFKNPKNGASNEIVAFVVFEKLTDQSQCVEAIRANYRRQLNLPCFLGKIHPIDKIPRNDDGKPMRALCQEMVLARVEGMREAFAP
ncbi:class I adenylate-forming enzyme family protein [Tabrizicola sp.]|uniref:class I adenylate-forming enzyme family protein n=1 Tax=Tabrizicola sp. TaxID=2005166 RepID=UPI00286A23B1|nr:class I adenylate-forming enzyme family protein [Tabrizicola sp.]